MKSKPEAPSLKRETYSFYIEIGEEATFAKITEYVANHKGDLDSIAISEVDQEWDDDHYVSSITISYQESKDSPSYVHRVAKYEEDLAMWEFWYSRHKEEYDTYIALEEEAKLLREKRTLEGKIRAQEYKVQKAQQELKDLQLKLIGS